MLRRRPDRGILIFLFTVLATALIISCSSTNDLVLDDPAFRHDMVEAAIAGEEFNITPEDYPEIRGLFADDRSSYRLAGVILAAQTGDDMFLPLIAIAALDPEPEVSSKALEMMQADPEAYRPTLREMLADDDRDIRVGAIRLLAETGDEDQVPLLISLFADPEPAVRNQATLSIRILTDRENPFLREALIDENPLVAAMAIRTLGGYADSRDIPVFIEAFDSGDSGIRREAQLAALRMGESGLPVLHKHVLDTGASYRSRLSSLEVIQGLRLPESLEVLMALLVDGDSRIAGKAQSVLGTYGAEAVPALRELYRVSAEDYRIHAIRLMGEIGSASASPTLAEALEDDSPRVRSLAYSVLESFGEDARPALRTRLLQGGSYSVPAALNLLLNGQDPWLAEDRNGSINTEALFLLIVLTDRSRIESYLEQVGATALIEETVLALKEAWEAGDEFAALEADIAAGTDPYLYIWRQREILSVASRDALKQSFDRLHDYFDSQDPQALTDARDIRAESRVMEAEARTLKERMDSFDPAVQRQGQVRLETYRTSRDFLVRTWEYIVPVLRPLAVKVYDDRGLDPDALARESVLLD